jgi:NADH dehydrogenase FAD-containing subunit
VGSVNNTFGIRGVAERCFFLKSIDDAHRLRVHIRCGCVGGRGCGGNGERK